MVAAVLTACGTGNSSETKIELSEELQQLPSASQEKVVEAMQGLELARLYLLQYNQSSSIDDLLLLKDQSEKMSLDYDDSDLSVEQKIQLLHIRMQVDSLRNCVAQLVETELPRFRTTIMNVEDKLFEDGQPETVSFYAQKGDTIFYRVQLNNTGTIRCYNADSHQQLFAHSQKKEVEGAFYVPNTAIYLLEITPQKAQYADIYVAYNSTDIEHLQHLQEVSSETVEANKGDFRAQQVKGVSMRNLFEEPRKFTLRGQLKAAFSGSARALVALQVPAGASDVMYSLRISTNEGDKYSDGKFKDNMDLSYRKIRFLGLPLYESQKGSGLLSTLLGENQPPREEDAYINMYVFFDAAQAKKFQDGKPASELRYNVDYSTLGTQSCNGRIPAQGHKTIYLAFENERMRYNNYVWLEAVSAVPSTEYFKTQYSVK